MTGDSINNISCVIIVKNAEKTIKNTLDSIKNFTDIILYSNNSTDKTNEIAKQYTNVRLIKGDFIGFGPTKNRAATFATNDWIFSLDADEVLTQELIENLQTIQLDNNNVYIINRTNFYKDTQVKYCWGNDKIIRLYNKRVTAFTDKEVHEEVLKDNLHTDFIDGDMQHFPYSSISEFIIKADRYSTLFAQNNAGKKSSSPLKALLNAKYSFIKTYIFKQGFRDGYVGLVIAFSHMVTNFYKYIKLYELNKELKDK